MNCDEDVRQYRFKDEEDSGLSDEEQERKRPKNRTKHTRKRIHKAKKNFLEKLKTASLVYMNSGISRCRGEVRPPVCVHVDVFGQANPAPTS